MMRSLFRCRYFLFWLLILSTIKLIFVFYNDFQDPTTEKFVSSKRRKIENHSSSTSSRSTSSINRTVIQIQRKFVQQMNEQQTMYNKELFIPQRTRYILLVQVHTRVVYLRKFIEMLKSVEMIEQTLLIFSHDFIDPDINALVQNITFVPVIQIFYPFSQQLYPDEFPGLDPSDCPRDMAKYKALATRCKNAPFPDKYGHYREVSIVQIKHHWWWKLNFVFNSIEILQNRSDHLILLLEEDFYLSPDALRFLEKMENEKSKLCPECLFFTLGNLEKSGRQFHQLASKVSIAYWHARYNLGMTISYKLWLSLVKYAEEFCNVDDYNWDWSLVYLAQQRLNYPRVMLSSGTRVIHLGSCGTHHKKTCSSESDIARWTETDRFYRDNNKYLFPNQSLTTHLKYEVKRALKQTNGGWSDLRDRQLCLSFALKTTKNFTNFI